MTGRSQVARVLHQVLLVVPRDPDGAEGTLLVSPRHPDQADHGGSQQEDQDHHEQHRQDHHWGETEASEMAGWGAAAGVGPHGAQGEDRQLLCLKSPTLPERVWRTDTAHQGSHRGESP